MVDIKTRFFCFPDMETSFGLAIEMGMVTFDDYRNIGFLAYTPEYAIDVIGLIYRPTGNILTDNLGSIIYDEDGNPVEEMAPVPGWHVNSRILTDKPLPEAFSAYEVFPKTAERDFF